MDDGKKSKTDATQILKWTSPDGKVKALLSVKDGEKEPRDVDYHRLELCEYRDDGYTTQEVISHVEEVTDYSIPQTLID